MDALAGVEARVAAAVAAERDGCAMDVWAYASRQFDPGGNHRYGEAAQEIRKLIRARSTAPADKGEVAHGRADDGHP